jgi:hypothetical protein
MSNATTRCTPFGSTRGLKQLVKKQKKIHINMQGFCFLSSLIGRIVVLTG